MNNMNNEPTPTELCKDCQGSGELYQGCHICNEGDYHTKCDSYYEDCHCIAGLRLRLARKPVHEN